MIGLSSVIRKCTHSPTTYFFFLASSALHLTSKFSQIIFVDLKVINKLNTGLFIWFNRRPLSVLLSFLHFFIVCTSIVLDLSLTSPSPEAIVVLEVLFSSVRSEIAHSRPLIIQRIWAVSWNNVCSWFHLNALIWRVKEQFCGLLVPLILQKWEIAFKLLESYG